MYAQLHQSLLLAALVRSLGGARRVCVCVCVCVRTRGTERGHLFQSDHDSTRIHNNLPPRAASLETHA